MSALLPDVNPKGLNYAILLRTDIDLDLDLDAKVMQAPSPRDTVLRPGGFIGWVGTWTSQPLPEVGFIFHRSTWGMGFATEALSGFLELFWRARPEFENLEAWVDEENCASGNVLKKCGFELVEVVEGDYRLKWMVPELRNSLHFRARRPRSDTTSTSTSNEDKRPKGH